MKVGYYTKDITPQIPVYMAGYNRKSKSIGVLDEILLNTLVWEIGNEKIIFIVIDSIMLEKSFCDSLRNEISQKYKIKMNKIFISCIHTHSAPAYFQLAFEDTVIERELLNDLYTQSLDCLEKANESLRECHMNLKKCMIDGLYGNRNVKEGWSDKAVYVIEFMNERETICQLLNISVHPTILNGENLLLSSDLLGAVRRKYQQRTHIPTIICNGATGDVSTRFYRESSGVEELEKVSTNVVNQMMDKLQTVLFHQSYTSFEVSEVEYITHSDFSKDPITQKILNQDDALAFFKERCQRKLSMKAFDMLLNAIVIKCDHLFLISLPGDVVSGFAKKVKDALSDYEVILICYTNNYCNYLVPEEEYGLYFETFNSRCMKGEADYFINKVIQAAKSLI